MICQECKMPDAPDYHPHLHCVIWRAYHIDPERMLNDHGYRRTPPENVETPK